MPVALLLQEFSPGIGLHDDNSLALVKVSRSRRITESQTIAAPPAARRLAVTAGATCSPSNRSISRTWTARFVSNRSSVSMASASGRASSLNFCDNRAGASGRRASWNRKMSRTSRTRQNGRVEESEDLALDHVRIGHGQEHGARDRANRRRIKTGDTRDLNRDLDPASGLRNAVKRHLDNSHCRRFRLRTRSQAARRHRNRTAV